MGRMRPIRPLRWGAVLAGLGLLSACAGGELTLLVEHPIADSVDFDLATLSIERVSPSPADLAALAARLTESEVIASIGAEGGEDAEAAEAEVFGQIVDVAVIGEGRVAVLDQMASRVALFDFDGERAGGFGGPGEGPGELDLPIALLVRDSTEIQVLDAVGRLHRFTEGDDGAWAFEERIELSGFPRAACAEPGRDRTVVHIPAVAPSDADLVAQGVLRLHDADGAHVRSFGTPYRYEQPLVANRMRRGQVVCTPGGQVLLALEGSNRVAAWAMADGEELWNAAIEGVEVPRLREMTLADGRPAVGQDPRGTARYHGLLTAVGMGGGRALLQYTRFHWGDDLEAPRSEAIESWIVEVATGAGGWVGEALPRVGAIQGDVVVLLHEDPWPRLEVARW